MGLLSTVKEKNILAGNPVDTEDNWKTKNPILLKGAIFITSDTNPIKFKIGNGIDTWADTPYVQTEAIGYSLEELNTGKKWLDGRYVYRKTIHIVNLPNDGQTITISHNIANLEQIISFTGSVKSTDGKISFLPVVNNSFSYPYITCDLTSIYISTTSESNSNSWSAYSGYITLEYIRSAARSVVTNSNSQDEPNLFEFLGM